MKKLAFFILLTTYLGVIPASFAGNNPGVALAREILGGIIRASEKEGTELSLAFVREALPKIAMAVILRFPGAIELGGNGSCEAIRRVMAHEGELDYFEAQALLSQWVTEDTIDLLSKEEFDLAFWLLPMEEFEGAGVERVRLEDFGIDGSEFFAKAALDLTDLNRGRIVYHALVEESRLCREGAVSGETATRRDYLRIAEPYLEAVLYHAVSERNLEIAEILLREISRKGMIIGSHLLKLAVEKGDLKMVSFLLDYNVEVTDEIAALARKSADEMGLLRFVPLMRKFYETRREIERRVLDRQAIRSYAS